MGREILRVKNVERGRIVTVKAVKENVCPSSGWYRNLKRSGGKTLPSLTEVTSKELLSRFLNKTRLFMSTKTPVLHYNLSSCRQHSTASYAYKIKLIYCPSLEQFLWRTPNWTTYWTTYEIRLLVDLPSKQPLEKYTVEKGYIVYLQLK